MVVISILNGGIQVSQLSRFFDSTGTIYSRCPGDFVLWRNFQVAFYAHDSTTEWEPAKLREELNKVNLPVGPGSRNRMVVGNVSDTRREPRQYIKNKYGDVRLEPR